MTVYVDDAFLRAPHLLGGQARWCHMTADTREELHAFAAKLGLKRGWFQDDEPFWHYDVVTRVRIEALRLGAEPVSTRELVKLSLKREGHEGLPW